MSSRVRFLLPLAGLCLVPSASATDLAYVKCAANQDRVWVYESLGSFDVEARLRCGAPVEILSRVKGYVKIRSESGVEGWVPDASFPDLPALPDEADKPLGSIAAQSLAAAAAAPAPTQPTIAVAAKPAEPVVVARTAPTASTASSVVPVPAAPPQPPPAATLATVSVPTAQPVAASRPAITIEPLPADTAAAAKPAATAPKAIPAKASTTSSHAKAAPSMTKKSEPTPESAPASAIVHSAPPAPVPAPAAPAKPSMETISASPRDSAAIVTATAKPAIVADDEEYQDTQPENESADPNCRIFFAAYGLAPSQYKWMAESRHKEFSGICPAPDVAHVDYVVLFTHDSDSYTYAMPVPVHTDHNGFSDFSPLTTVDTALISASEVEKARYEFVWVFHVTRGAFDPAKFSARRKPQFTTYVKGSRASQRSIEDAFNFVETQGATR